MNTEETPLTTSPVPTEILSAAWGHMNPDEALLTFDETTAEAVRGVVPPPRSDSIETGSRALAGGSGGGEDEGREFGDGNDAGLSSMLRAIPVRVAAEFGRATLSLEQVAYPKPGAVIELDRSSDDPIDLCVNGRRFATGRLFLVNQTEWAMRIEHVLDANAADFASPAGAI